MIRVFADTSFYVALLSPTDTHHRAAAELATDPALRVTTTEFVLIELANFFAASGRRREIPRLLDALSAGRTTRVVAASRSLFGKGLAVFRSRPDKAWSLTDCTSFVIMESHGLSGALTADRHFEQAGFRAMLR
jgi:predicted nucleic acid-binding protein